MLLTTRGAAERSGERILAYDLGETEVCQLDTKIPIR